MSHCNYKYSCQKKTWNVNICNLGRTGGNFHVSNLSNGYHGILKQWWEYYNKGTDVLLISENNVVKQQFKNIYPNWNIVTLDYYPELIENSSVDIVENICNKNFNVDKKFDLIINQATLEHVYNPFQAMENLISILKPEGILVSHTHPPACPYHSYPRDYFRFMIDWWIDLPKYIENIQLCELYMHDNLNVFTCYKKL